MSRCCLKAGGTDNLIVKLRAERVSEIVTAGTGLPFAPNGRVFREWVAFPTPDEETRSALLDEARTRPKPPWMFYPPSSSSERSAETLPGMSRRR